MEKYRVSLEVDKEWVKNFDLTFDAADEQDAEAQAMIGIMTQTLHLNIIIVIIELNLQAR